MKLWWLFTLVCCTVIIAAGIWGVTLKGPTKAERIDRLEQQVHDLESRVEVLEIR